MRLVSIILLTAGASAYDPSAFGGALAFAVGAAPSWADLNYGSALSCEYPA